jgi:hypothetical protein
VNGIVNSRAGARLRALGRVRTVHVHVHEGSGRRPLPVTESYLILARTGARLHALGR